MTQHASIKRLGHQFTTPLGLFRLLLPVLLAISFLFEVPSGPLAAIWAALGVTLVLLHRADPINFAVAFVLPWTGILLFSALEISEYSREISRAAVLAVATVVAIAGTVTPALRTRSSRVISISEPTRASFWILLLIYAGFCILNVALAGYIPLVNAILHGDSGYMDFGVKGIYGLFNAYANALGLYAFILWLKFNRSLYKYTFFVVLLMFLIFVTRQNMISLLVECFVVYNFIIRRVAVKSMLVLSALVLIVFGYIGDLRVGQDIADIARIKEQYRWIPSSVIWLYSYCYFNILNLDNVIAISHSPVFDGSSLAQLLPSFLRPQYLDEAELLEVSSFTVNSFISPIIRDFGLPGLAALFLLFCRVGLLYRSMVHRKSSLLGVTGYSVLYFCFLFSFFVNFWFYLPVIFQLAFFWAFDRLLPKVRSRAKAKHRGIAGISPTLATSND
jgi:oligosaccharide repeat unit polymerase